MFHLENPKRSENQEGAMGRTFQGIKRSNVRGRVKLGMRREIIGQNRGGNMEKDN